MIFMGIRCSIKIYVVFDLGMFNDIYGYKGQVNASPL